MTKVPEPKLFSRILLIEDDKSHALLIERALRDFSSKILFAESLRSGLELYSKEQPELVISDLNLPDTTGVNDIHKLVNVIGETPLIVLTSSTLIQDAVQALKYGAKDYVVKDFDLNFKEVLGFALSRVFSTKKLESERRRLEQEMQVLRTAIENGNDGMAILDSKGVFEYLNPAFAKFVERCGGEISSLGQIFSDKIKHVDSLKQNLLKNLSTLQVGSVWHTEATIEGDKLIAYDLSLSCFEKKQDNAIFVLWIKDISELKRRERFQRELLATTSHDLKGPLGTISLSSELITSYSKKGEKVYEIALRIGASAHGAINLIDEFLSARRLEEGAFVLRPELVDINKLLEGVDQNYTTIAQARNIELKFKTFGQIYWILDELAIQRALGNLVSNALKFTPKGGQVTVEVDVTDSFIRFIVEDTGCGMEAAEIQGIFERYSRLSRHAAVEGSGLGLFVTKSIVSAHGGGIEVRSQIKKGTRFEIFLPKELPLDEQGKLRFDLKDA